MALNPADLAAMRGTVSAFLPQAATLTRDGTERQSGVPCRISPDSFATHLDGFSKEIKLRRWAITLPFDADVAAGDVLAVDGFGTYAVVMLDTPNSNSASTTVYAYQLTDTSGTLVYIQDNATVSCVRPLSGATIYYARRVRLFFPSPNESMVGGLPTLRARMYDDPNADWEPGDLLTIAAQDGITADLIVSTYTLGGVIRRSDPLPILEAEIAGQPVTGPLV